MSPATIETLLYRPTESVTLATQARSLAIMADHPKSSIRIWSIEQKARVLADACQLNGEELTAHLEREGVRRAEYEQWRLALDEGGAASTATNGRIRELERELARNEKALAEAAALPILKKKPLCGSFRRIAGLWRHRVFLEVGPSGFPSRCATAPCAVG